MPTLDFEGKSHIYAHHYTVPCAPLVPDPAKSVGEPSVDGNLVIHGDNLYGLKALLPRYHGRVKCVYIDPPYNTGNEGWTYNDNGRGPVLSRWYEANGPVDGDDPERHEKWLCMMWPRLQLLKELLAEDGVIFVSIDDNELHHLRMLMDEIFEARNFVADFLWNSTKSNTNPALVSLSHTHTITYAKDIEIIKSERDQFKLPPILTGFSNPDRDPRGPWKADPFEAGGERPNQMYPITNPNTGEVFLPRPGNCWKNDRQRFEELLADNRIVFGKSGKSRPQRKRFQSEAQDRGLTPNTWWDSVGTTTSGTRELKQILKDTDFANPKPSEFIQRVIRLATTEDSIVLDSFAGSGTTAQAVLELNREDGGNRKFILVECEDYADTVTAERVRRVIAGVPDARDAGLREGLGGSFTYCTLGAPIGVEGMLSGEALPPYESLAAWLLHTATGAPTETAQLRAMNEDGHFHSDGEKDYYLLYEPDVDWLRSDDAVLTELRAMRIRDAARADGRRPIVFAAAKYMGQSDLTGEFGITFCQLPWEIHRRPDGDRWS